MLPSHGRSHWFKSSTAYQKQQGFTAKNSCKPFFIGKIQRMMLAGGRLEKVFGSMHLIYHRIDVHTCPN